MYMTALIVHVLAATIWTGGHLVLALAILPGALRERSPAIIEAFERPFEKVGLPALLLQVASGLYLATRLAPAPASWLAFDTPVTRAIAEAQQQKGLMTASRRCPRESRWAAPRRPAS